MRRKVLPSSIWRFAFFLLSSSLLQIISQATKKTFFSTFNMSGPGVGFEYPRQQVSWLKRDALLFANSIGCKADELHFLYVSQASFLWLEFELTVS
jgi:hypothetical protein